MADHYDELDRWYLEIWGEHVHHGLWRRGDEPPERAVRMLVEHLVSRLSIGPGMRVCDVGCGYGATSRMLAERGARPVGYTLSRMQHKHACERNRVGETEFLLCDWMANGMAGASFDAVISIESSEHMPDKRAFFAEAMRVLRPGGRLGVYAWLSCESPRSWEVRHLLEPICREGRLPSMGSESDYRGLIEGAGFVDVAFEELSREVSRTWTLCAVRMARRLARDPEARRFLLRGPENRVFAKTLLRIWTAYRLGTMRYGLFTARKPAEGGVAHA